MNRSTLRVGFALLLAGSMLFYVQGVLIPYQRKDAAASDRPRGNLSDLYPRWLGARELLLNGRNPYSSEITREIQQGYYGRPLEAGRPGEPLDQQGFAYPAHVVFLLSPTVTLPFPVVQRAFLWFLLVLTAASVVFWLRFLQWRPSYGTIAILAALTVGSFAVVQGLKLQQLSLLVGGFISLAAALLSFGYMIPAGVVMAFATIKPQLTFPIAGWLLLWALGDLRNRKRYVLSFGATTGALLAGAELLLPGWIARFRDALAAYRVYTGGTGSLLDSLMGLTWGRILAAALILIALFLCWRARKGAVDSPQFLNATAFVLAVTVVIVPMIAPYNQVLLLPSILLLARRWPHLSTGNLPVRALSVICGAMIAWQWVGASALTIASAFVSPDRVQQWWAVPLFSSLFIPLSVVALHVASMSFGRENRRGQTVCP